MKDKFKYNPIAILLLLIVFIQCSSAQKISRSVTIIPGAVNGALIEKNGRNLIIYGDPAGRIKNSEMVLFTHFRRDVIWAGRKLVRNGSFAVAPAKEKSYFTRGDSIWQDFRLTRFHDYNCQTTKIGILPLKVPEFVQGGDILTWQGIDIKVLNTPGYTRGAVSYIADIDNKRIAFTGDLIYGDGKIFNLYSFQDSVKIVGGYHGYAVRLGQLISSLELIGKQKPDILVPVRGPVITDPAAAIKKLIGNIHALYGNYLAITANRFLHPDRMKVLSDHVLGPSVTVEPMPYGSVFQKDMPSWYKHISNSNLVMAEDSSAFLIDCGTKNGLEQIIKMKQSGRLKSLDGIFITHYHDDHTNFINDLVREFGCPVYATVELKDILKDPGAYHMPCLTGEPIPGLTTVQSGQKLHWKDFVITFHYFPGQTIYHDAALFEKNNGESIFFTGDSFTPSGIDDYCLLNRNFLHPGTGYFYCLDLLGNLPENILQANQHLEPLFSFSRQQIDLMRTLLTKRNAILKDLLPWDDINYGVDEQWVKVNPYVQRVKPGRSAGFSVKIFNHSDKIRTFTLNPVLPEGYKIIPDNATKAVMPLNEGEFVFKMMVPENAEAGIDLLMFNIGFDGWELHEWSESLIEISLSDPDQ